MRKQFEEWCMNELGIGETSFLMVDGVYQLAGVQNMWLCWNAAAGYDLNAAYNAGWGDCAQKIKAFTSEL